MAGSTGSFTAPVCSGRLLSQMTPDDFSPGHGRQIPRLLGILFSFAEKAGLRFFVGTLLGAAIQGNPGQANYAAANRMMSALLKPSAGKNNSIRFKAFDASPVEGAGNGRGSGGTGADEAVIVTGLGLLGSELLGVSLERLELQRVHRRQVLPHRLETVPDRKVARHAHRRPNGSDDRTPGRPPGSARRFSYTTSRRNLGSAATDPPAPRNAWGYPARPGRGNLPRRAATPNACAGAAAAVLSCPIASLFHSVAQVAPLFACGFPRLYRHDSAGRNHEPPPTATRVDSCLRPIQCSTRRATTIRS